MTWFSDATATTEINASELEQIGVGDISGDRFVAMVTSPLCPYCHKADKFLSENASIPVKRIFLIDLRSPNNPDVQRAVEFMQTAVKGERDSLVELWRTQYLPTPQTPSIETIERLNAMYDFNRRNAIDGTPYIYLVDRKNGKVDRLIAGYGDQTASEILDWFKGKK
jgi:glutaredoxin